MIRRPPVVGVEESEGVALREFAEAVARGGDALVGAEVFVANGLWTGLCSEPHEGLGAVVGAVFNDDDFPVLMSLGLHTGDGFGEGGRGVIRGDEHTDFHARPSAKASHARLRARAVGKSTTGV